MNYTKARRTPAYKQYKEHIERLEKSERGCTENPTPLIREGTEDFPVVSVDVDRPIINVLTPNENRELECELRPSSTTHGKTHVLNSTEQY